MGKKIIVALVIVVIVVIVFIHYSSNINNTETLTPSPVSPPTPSGGQVQKMIFQKNISGVFRYNRTVNIPKNVSEIIILNADYGVGNVNFTIESGNTPVDSEMYYSSSLSSGGSGSEDIFPLASHKYVSSGTWYMFLSCSKPIYVNLSIYVEIQK